ncbi:MAG TPA: LPS export ABC transporter periplasmic protein LptC [Firmicutes bacterium]|jgi:LPS export ABC transporter protein LptC|nr:LPS export ABC transporter periplasmic protein LptC [Bacillota bacterium]
MLFLKKLQKLFVSKTLWTLLVAGFIIWTLLPHKEKDLITPGKEGFTLYGVTLVGRDQRGRLWEVRAEEVWQAKNGNEVICSNVEQVVVYTEDQEEDFAFSSGWAHLQRKKDHLHLGGGIRCQLEGGFFNTEEAEINLDTRMITCPQPVVFTREDLQISAGRMEGNIDTEDLIFTGEVVIEKKGEICIRGETLHYWGEKKHYELLGGVEMEL